MSEQIVGEDRGGTLCHDPKCQCCWDAVGFFAAFASFLDTHGVGDRRTGEQVRSDIRSIIESMGNNWYGERWARFRSMTVNKMPEDFGMRP